MFFFVFFCESIESATMLLNLGHLDKDLVSENYPRLGFKGDPVRSCMTFQTKLCYRNQVMISWLTINLKAVI